MEYIDEILHSIAAKCRFSSPAVRASTATIARPDDDLANLYRRLSPRDAKWLTRLVLKDYQPITLDRHAVVSSYNELLPMVLKVQHDLPAAVSFLQHQARTRNALLGPLGKAELVKHLEPKLGVKVGRQPFFMGRSIKHCMDMTSGFGRVSCERKMDGEYAQVHIDLSKGHNCIQIFSKSGKDSTKDRIKLQEYVAYSRLKLTGADT